MFLQPKKTVFRKYKKSFLKKTPSSKINCLKFGDFGLKILNSFRITAKQLESLRQCINRELKREGKLWFRVFPHIPVTKQPTENRMGKGKGSVEYWVAEIQPGKVLYEMDGVQEHVAREAFRLAAAKLPLRTVFVHKNLG